MRIVQQRIHDWSKPNPPYRTPLSLIDSGPSRMGAHNTGCTCTSKPLFMPFGVRNSARHGPPEQARLVGFCV